MTRGHGLWERFLAAVFGFPRAADLVEVEVVKTATAKGEIWERRFGQSRFRSVLSHGPEGMTEAFGPFRFAIGLHAAAGAVHFPVTGGGSAPFPCRAGCCPYRKRGKTCVTGGSPSTSRCGRL